MAHIRSPGPQLQVFSFLTAGFFFFATAAALFFAVPARLPEAFFFLVAIVPRSYLAMGAGGAELSRYGGRAHHGGAAPSGPAMTNVFCRYDLRTTDPDAARGFYAEVAGLDLTGDYINQNKDDTAAYYGRDIHYEDILSGRTRVHASSRAFVAAVSQLFREGRAAK